MAKKPGNKGPIFFTKIRRKDEEILWKYNANIDFGLNKVSKVLLYLLIASFACVILGFVIGIESDLLYALPIPFIIIFVGYVALEEGGLVKTSYLLTNERAIIYTPAQGREVEKLNFFNYEQLEGCIAEDFYNKSRLSFLGRESGFVFKEVGANLDRKAYDIVIENSRKVGRFKIVQSMLLDYQEQFRLNMEYLGDNTSLKGKVNACPFVLKIEGVLPIEKLYVEFLIPNPENNNFRIQAENQLGEIQKVNKQDIEIGDEETDDAYLLESNNLFFLKTILNDEIREKLNIDSNEIKSRIEFGTYEKNKRVKRIKTNFKPNDDVLDAHLLEGSQVENEDKEELYPDLKSRLILNLKIKSETKGDEAVSQIKRDFELMQLLAQGINNYYER